MHGLAPELVLSVNIGSPAELQQYLDAGLPADQLLAFMGIGPQSPTLYKALDEAGIPQMRGTFGREDEAAATNPTFYRELKAKGLDVIATNRPIEAAEALSGGD